MLYRNRAGNPWILQRLRPQRNRKNDVTRSFVRENVVTARYILFSKYYALIKFINFVL